MAGDKKVWKETSSARLDDWSPAAREAAAKARESGSSKSKVQKDPTLAQYRY